MTDTNGRQFSMFYEPKGLEERFYPQICRGIQQTLLFQITFVKSRLRAVCKHQLATVVKVNIFASLCHNSHILPHILFNEIGMSHFTCSKDFKYFPVKMLSNRPVLSFHNFSTKLST